MMQRLLAVLAAAVALGVVELALWLHRAHDWHPALAMLGAAAVPVLADAAILGQQFAIGAWLRRRTRPELRPGLAAALRAWFGEIVASLRTFFYAQIRYGARPLPSGAGRDRVPVLLVHGYFCNRQLWRPMARALAARGHAVAAVDLEPVFASIDDYVGTLEREVARLARRTAAPAVALVCHSMGGLAARAYLRARPDAPVCRVVTLGTPHRGTVHARFGLGENARQMRREGEWLGELERSETSRARALFTVVLSHHDNIVTPQASQTLPGARVLEFSALGHLTLARAPEVIDTVIAELGRA